MSVGLGSTIKYVNHRGTEVSVGSGIDLSMKSTISDRIANASRTNCNFGSSSKTRSGVPLYGIGAQRSKVGTGQHLNAKAFYSNSNYSAVQSMNQGVHFSADHWIPPVIHEKTKSNTNTLQMVLGLTAALAGIAPSVIEAINSGKSSAPASKANEMTDLSKDSYNFGDASKFPMTTELKGAKSFGDINKLEQKANEKLQNFNSDYGKLETTTKKGIDETLANADVKAGMELAGVTVDTSKLSLSEVSIDPEDVSSFDEAAKTIDKDIETVNKFSADLNTSIGTLQSKSEELGQSITSFTAQIQTLESDIIYFQSVSDANPDDANMKSQLEDAKKNLETAKQNKQKAETEKKQVDAAKTELEGIKTKDLAGLVKDLEAKKTDLGDIKQVKADLADKKYDLAKEQDKEIGDNNKKMEGLKKKIDNPKSKDDKNKLIEEYNKYASRNIELGTSLRQAGDAIKNSKGKEYSVKNTPNTNVLSSAPNSVSSKPSIDKSKIQLEQVNLKSDVTLTTEMLNATLGVAIDNCKNAGDTITIGNATYKLEEDGNFRSDKGDIFTRDQLVRIGYNDRNVGKLGI